MSTADALVWVYAMAHLVVGGCMVLGSGSGWLLGKFKGRR